MRRVRRCAMFSPSLSCKCTCALKGLNERKTTGQEGSDFSKLLHVRISTRGYSSGVITLKII
ncbi:uncharacterized protein PGTG_22118 [Puccinia graminis f. sp. tritici CRL 75-36-700-3]|uniref:Uncharacterized protein n=1 Tax=Puccinia graminis f. sp. tritici (strain CRL 75-36-700-3 / race SCCL) TaxID=418459 RepID=H6QTK5_PUCGT|nr:uncharacterized protein PGTG_22118 [Puccinia graminis f. sp. tritici CRL 75-36-700-3]EHS64220.1 hypothetical protein PGTG_22118 [Puccinia graminis f. sp. tritici CRL 75-36-700-3]